MVELNNNFKTLLDLSDLDELLEKVDDTVQLIKQDKISEKDKSDFIKVFEEIINRKDFFSYNSVCFLRDIMTKELYSFLLQEFKESVFCNVPLAVEIMKIITIGDFPDYYTYLEEIKDNELLSSNFTSFIHKVLDFHNGVTTNLSFPILNRKNAQTEKIEIIWE